MTLPASIISHPPPALAGPETSFHVIACGRQNVSSLPSPKIVMFCFSESVTMSYYVARGDQLTLDGEVALDYVGDHSGITVFHTREKGRQESQVRVMHVRETRMASVGFEDERGCEPRLLQATSRSQKKQKTRFSPRTSRKNIS